MKTRAPRSHTPPDAAPIPASMPLGGLRVLELGQLVAGPFACSLLAGFGAEVIKIEPPGEGDPLRRWRKMYQGTSLWWRVMGRNKQSVALDLRDPLDRPHQQLHGCILDAHAREVQ